MAKYRKKPVIVEAFIWSGNSNQKDYPNWLHTQICTGNVRFNSIGTSGVVLLINTPEGIMRANPGDYIIKGIKGEIYPCKPDIFDATYEKVEDE